MHNCSARFYENNVNYEILFEGCVFSFPFLILNPFVSSLTRPKQCHFSHILKRAGLLFVNVPSSSFLSLLFFIERYIASCVAIFLDEVPIVE